MAPPDPHTQRMSVKTIQQTGCHLVTPNSMVADLQMHTVSRDTDTDLWGSDLVAAARSGI